MGWVIGNRYELIEQIGAGGMGIIYRGIDTQSGQMVAVKQLKTETNSPEAIERFKREGEALSRLNHPNIVKLLNVVEQDGENYLILEYIQGGDLNTLQSGKALSVNRVISIALELADALTRAHHLKIIHRDLKPANVLVAEDGTIRLTDFGVARLIEKEAVTHSGDVMGTVKYMAPEVLSSGEIDTRADIWSFGVMLFELLTGNSPFERPSIIETIMAITSAPVPDLEKLRPDCPAALVDLIYRMLDKDSHRRISSVRLVGAELEVILQGHTPQFLAEALPLRAEPKRFDTTTPLPYKGIPNNLPVQTSPFVGREHELAELEKLLWEPSVRLLTLAATGGMGKTRLAVEFARTMLTETLSEPLFEHGVYFIDLAPLTSPETIVQTVADSLGYSIQQDGRDAKRQILDFLREKYALLIMDNFEHVIQGRMLVQEILEAAPSVKIIVTSRERLNLSMETIFILGGLDFPEWSTPDEAFNYVPVKLFMQSARRVRPNFLLTPDDLVTVARICRKVQGTPLGIVLAAAWVESLSLNEIVEEIEQNSDFLETTLHDVPERQRSLRAVFEYSWALLADQERELLPRFFVFRGGFTREAAQAVTGTNLRSLNMLIAKSLLHRDNTSGRYDIHELLRQYLEEKAELFGDPNAFRNAHGQYYCKLVAQLTPRLKAAGQLDALSAMETDFENIRTAWLWMIKQKDADGLSAAIEGMHLFLTFRNRQVDAQQLFNAAQNAWPANGDDPGLLAGRLLVRFPGVDSLSAFQQGLTIAEQYGDSFEIAFCQRLVGHWLSHNLYNQTEGIPTLEKALNGFRALNDSYYIALTLDDLGWSARLTMRLDIQRNLVGESLAIRRTISDRIGTANSLRNLGGAYTGFFDRTGRALAYWKEAKDIAYEMKDRTGIVWNSVLSAGNLIFMGEFDQAQALIDEAMPHALNLNDPVLKGTAKGGQAILLALRDENYGMARGLLEEAYPPGLPQDFRMVVVPYGLSLVACGLDDPTVLMPYLDAYMKTKPFGTNSYLIPEFMPYIIYLLARDHQYERAVEFMGAYLNDVFQHMGTPFPIWWVQRWGLFLRLQRQLADYLGTQVFEDLMQRGKQSDPTILGGNARRFLRNYYHLESEPD
jgi:serine/threonine protein kinase